MKKQVTLFVFMLLPNILFSQIFFQPNIIIDDTYSTNGAFSVYSVDIDGDGDMDVLSASQYDNKVAWYENMDGLGTFGLQKVISDNLHSTRYVHAADLDNDGDMDVLSLSPSDNKVVWFKNIDGLGNFSSEIVVATNTDNVFIIHAIDIDGDNDLDLVSASSGDHKIVWYENLDGLGNFSSGEIIDTTIDALNSVWYADMDLDGDLDIVSNSWSSISWYENLDGLGNFSSSQILIDNLNIDLIYVADLDGDGDTDILSGAYYGRIAWYENLDGLGNFGAEQTITMNADSPKKIYVSDIDGDGDNDVLSASWTDDLVAWYENLDGLGNFSNQQMINMNADSPSDVYTADIDGDGDMDVLTATSEDNIIAWYENIDGQGTFSIEQPISTYADFPVSTYAVDIDGDGDMDVLSASFIDDRIAWYENTDGQGNFGLQQVISTENEMPHVIFAADIDSDGDIDVFAGSNSKIVWFENLDGNGTFSSANLILDIAGSVTSLFTADIDNDGDLDLLSATSFNDRIAWYENIDGQGTFGSQQIISNSADSAKSVYAADIDGDGDMDVLSASWYDNKIAWYENQDGLGNFGAQQIISTNLDFAECVFASDIDGDGDLDVLSASSEDNKIAWYENQDGLGNFGIQQIITTSAYNAYSVYSADIDGDGDVDVLSASFADNKIAWYENLDGLGNFGNQLIITNQAEGAQSVFATDMDNDGDMDVLSASSLDDTIAWYENIVDNTPPVPDNPNLPDIVVQCSLDTINNPPTATDDISGTITGVPDVGFPITSQGTTVITWTYDDGHGNITTQTQNVIIEDTTPPVAIGQNLQVNLEGNTSISISANDVDSGSYDNCAIETMSLSQDTFMTTGVFSIVFTVIDIGGNSDSVTVEVEVINQTSIVYETSVEELNIFPNPTYNYIDLKAKHKINKVEIKDLTGKVIRIYSFKDNEIKLSINDLPKGVYLLQIELGKIKLDKKIIKK